MTEPSTEPPAWYTKAVTTPGAPISAVVDGVRVHARSWGDGGPGCLLVHGGGANGSWWDHLAPLLAEDYRVVAVDLSGHGDSDHRPSYGAEVWAPELPAVARAAGLPVPYFAVAHSVGGWVALRAAIDHRNEMAGVVLIDSTPRRRGDDDAERFGDRAFAPPRTADSEDELLRRFRTVPDDPWVQAYTLGHIARHSIRTVDGRWMWKLDRKVFARTEWQAAELLATAPCRVALLRGAHGLIDDDEAQLARDLLGRRAPIVTIPETGHHTHLDSPLAVLTAVRALLAAWNCSLEDA